MLHIDILRSAYDAVTKVGEQFSEALQSGPTGARLSAKVLCGEKDLFHGGKVLSYWAGAQLEGFQ